MAHAIIFQNNQFSLGEIGLNTGDELLKYKNDNPSSLIIMNQAEKLILSKFACTIDREEKKDTQALSRYLLNQDSIPFVFWTAENAGQFIRSIKDFTKQAKSIGDSNLFIVLVNQDLFLALRSRILKNSLENKEEVMVFLDDEFPYEKILSALKDIQIPSDLHNRFHGDSKFSQLIKKLILKASKFNDPVLVLGETGTGKEVIANEIHNFSEKKGKIIAVNCGAIPTELFETEFFGCVKGAYTSAIPRNGYVTVAQNGTLFLDEIGDLSKYHQVKLLRFLQEKKYRKVGSNEEMPESNARIITATNKNLLVMVRRGTFREDLYYRLASIVIHAPSVADQPEEIPKLAQQFWKIVTDDKNSKLSPLALNEIKRYKWHGNRREMLMLLRSVFIFYGKENISAKHIKNLYLYQKQTSALQKETKSVKEIVLHKQYIFRHMCELDEILRSIRRKLRPIINKEKVSDNRKLRLYDVFISKLTDLDILSTKRNLFPNQQIYLQEIKFYTKLLNYSKKFIRTKLDTLSDEWWDDIEPDYVALEKRFFQYWNKYKEEK
jgi:transcriptional regulator with PAS, ATPase and Fis domain